MLKRAVLAFRSGDKQTARDLLLEASEHNPDNELVWLWRASAARTRTEAYEAVVRVLDLNPHNEKALQWIEKLRPEPAEPAPAVREAEPAHETPATSNGHVAVSDAEVEEAEAVEAKEEAREETDRPAQTEEQGVAEGQAPAEQPREQALITRAPEVETQEPVEEEAHPEASDAEARTAAPAGAEVAPAADDAEARLAALEAALGGDSREEASTPADEATQVVEGYGWGASEAADQESADEDADDLLARLTGSGSASDQEDASEDDTLIDILGSREEAAAEDLGQRSEAPVATSGSARLRVEPEEDVWAALGMAGMDERQPPAATRPASGLGGSDSAGMPMEIALPDKVEAFEEGEACFVCEKLSQPQDGLCSSCRAIVDLDLLDFSARHDGADRPQLMRALDRLREEIEAKPTAKLYVQAALTCLNLRQSQQALLYLREAVRLRPHDRGLIGYYDKLERRPLILAVDDSKTVQKMISTVLEKESYRIVQAEDGLSAIAKLDEELPSLILLDITMPRMDGYQVCKVITGNDATKHIPVIMLSGKDGFFDKVRGKMVGASNYVTKPFDPGDLTKTIAKFLKN